MNMLPQSENLLRRLLDPDQAVEALGELSEANPVVTFEVGAVLAAGVRDMVKMATATRTDPGHRAQVIEWFITGSDRELYRHL